MTKEEITAYLKKVAQESGVSGDDMAVLERAFANEKFSQQFIPTPEFSRGLDQERNRSRAIQERNKYLEEEWFPSAKAKYDQAVQAQERYNQLVAQINGGGNGNGANGNSNGNGANGNGAAGFDAEKLQRYFDDQLAARDRAILDLNRVQTEHFNRFNRHLSIDDFESFVAKRRKEGSNDSVVALHREYIQPDLEKLAEAKQAELIKRAKEEAIADFASRNKIPADARPRERSILHERADAEQHGSSGNGNLSAKDEFLAILADQNPETLRQRYPG